MKQLLVFLICLMLVVIAGCDDSDTTGPDFRDTAGNTTGSSGCGSSGSDNGHPEECLEVNYQGNGTLTIQHTNACHFCDADTSSAVITIGEGEIIIDERPFGGMADCRCLFDIEYTIVNVPPGLYEIRLAGSAQDPPLTIAINLDTQSSKEACVVRGEC